MATAMGGEALASTIVSRAYPAAEKHMSDKVHGTIMGVTIALIFPFGALSWHLFSGVFSSRTILKIHVFSQLLGLGLLISGFGVGIWVAFTHAEVYNDPNGHAVLGTILVILFLFQPILGAYHHYYIFRAGKAESNKYVRLAHIWLGRILWIVAACEVGTGLFLANNAVDGEKAYGTLAGIIGVTWIAIVIASIVGKTKKGKKAEKELDSPNTPPPENGVVEIGVGPEKRS